MSQLDKTALVAKLNSFITTNGVGYITGAVAREIMRDMIDSCLNTLDEMPLYLKRSGTISGQPMTGNIETSDGFKIFNANGFVKMFNDTIYGGGKSVEVQAGAEDYTKSWMFFSENYFSLGYGTISGFLKNGLEFNNAHSALYMDGNTIFDAVVNSNLKIGDVAKIGFQFYHNKTSNETTLSAAANWAGLKYSVDPTPYISGLSLVHADWVTSQINAVIASAPGALDTLNELAAAMGDDPNFAATVTASLAAKEPTITPGTSGQYWRGDKTWQTLDKTAVGLSNVPNIDATNPANISQTASYRFVTDTEKGSWNAKEPAITVGSVGQYWKHDKTFADLNIAAVDGLSAALNVVNKGTLSFNLKGSLSSGMSALISSLVSGGTITSWYIEGEEASGSVVVDLQKWNGSSYVSIIGAGNKPTITAAKNANAAVSGWTSTTLAVNDRLRFVVDSVSSFSEVNLQIKYTKS